LIRDGRWGGGETRAYELPLLRKVRREEWDCGLDFDGGREVIQRVWGSFWG